MMNIHVFRIMLTPVKSLFISKGHHYDNHVCQRHTMIVSTRDGCEYCSVMFAVCIPGGPADSGAYCVVPWSPGYWIRGKCSSAVL